MSFLPWFRALMDRMRAWFRGNRRRPRRAKSCYVKAPSDASVQGLRTLDSPSMEEELFVECPRGIDCAVVGNSATRPSGVLHLHRAGRDRPDHLRIQRVDPHSPQVLALHARAGRHSLTLPRRTGGAGWE